MRGLSEDQFETQMFAAYAESDGDGGFWIGVPAAASLPDATRRQREGRFFPEVHCPSEAAARRTVLQAWGFE